VRLLPTRLGAGIAAVAFATSGISASANSYPCFEEGTVQSARIHDLRIMLMVNALKCRETAPTTLRSYGQLIESRYDEFSEHAEFVEASMVDRHGPHAGRAAFDDYETRIGNYHSDVRPSIELCNDTAAFIDLASRADHAELETLSKLATNRDIPVCAAPREVTFDDAAAYRAPAQQALPNIREVVPPREASRSAVARAPQVVDGVPTYAAPGTGVDTQPEPLERAAIVAAVAEPEPTPVAEAPAPAAQPDRFEQAIAALDAAADALRDLKASEPTAK